jgi:hypothetical protein
MLTVLETAMRYLLCTVIAVVACGPAETARKAERGETAAVPTVAETPPPPPAAPAPSRAPDSAFAALLAGTWNAKGYDSGSTRPQRFTITWTRAPDGGLTGKIAFRAGEKYNVKVVSTSDNTVVYESEPHRSPTLATEVVTRTEARLAGDSLSGTYEARATGGGKSLRGRFSATRAAAAPAR